MKAVASKVLRVCDCRTRILLRACRIVLAVAWAQPYAVVQMSLYAQHSWQSCVPPTDTQPKLGDAAAPRVTTVMIR